MHERRYAKNLAESFQLTTIEVTFACSLGLFIPGHVVRASLSAVLSDTSPKCIDREGLGGHRTGTRQW